MDPWQLNESQEVSWGSWRGFWMDTIFPGGWCCTLGWWGRFTGVRPPTPMNLRLGWSLWLGFWRGFPFLTLGFCWRLQGRVSQVWCGGPMCCNEMGEESVAINSWPLCHMCGFICHRWYYGTYMVVWATEKILTWCCLPRRFVIKDVCLCIYVLWFWLHSIWLCIYGCWIYL
jgi:hypothetical protein